MLKKLFRPKNTVFKSQKFTGKQQIRQFSTWKFNSSNSENEGSSYRKYLTPLMLGAMGFMYYKAGNQEEIQNSFDLKKYIPTKATTECEEMNFAYKRDTLEKRVNILQYPSNNPCEDRFNAYQLRKTPGFYAAVFDGKYNF